MGQQWCTPLSSANICWVAELRVAWPGNRVGHPSILVESNRLFLVMWVRKHTQSGRNNLELGNSLTPDICLSRSAVPKGFGIISEDASLHAWRGLAFWWFQCIHYWVHTCLLLLRTASHYHQVLIPEGPCCHILKFWEMTFTKRIRLNFLCIYVASGLDCFSAQRKGQAQALLLMRSAEATN